MATLAFFAALTSPDPFRLLLVIAAHFPDYKRLTNAPPQSIETDGELVVKVTPECSPTECRLMSSPIARAASWILASSWKLRELLTAGATFRSARFRHAIDVL